MDAVYLLAGEDDYLKDVALETIKNKTLGRKKEEEELNYRIFYTESTKAQEAIDCVRSLGFLGKRQLVLVRDFDRFSSSDKKLILHYSKSPNKSTVLILEVTDKSNLKKDIYKELLNYCKLIECNSPPLSSISRWITKFATSRRKRISKEAVHLLIMNLGRNLRAIDTAIEKLSLYIGQRRDITSEYVKALVGFDIDYSAYNFTDAIGKRDTRNALRIVRRLVVNRNEALKLLGRITWHFGRIHKAKKLLKQGESNREVVKQLNIPSFLIDKFFQQLNNFSFQAIKEAFKYVLDADLALKTKKIKPRIILESLVFKLCSLR